MLLQIHGVGDQKIAYKDHKDIKFDSLQTYLLLAKKAISNFANQFYQGLATKMLKDEDAIASIANAIMMADWRWDENYQNTKGTKKTKYSYRNQCALWAIQTLVTKITQHNKKFKSKILSLDFINDSMDDPQSVYSFTMDEKIENPENLIINEEKIQELSNLINSLLNSEYLTDRQRDYIRLYYFESYTFEKIGKKYGITREAVRQGLNKAMDIIREFIDA